MSSSPQVTFLLHFSFVLQFFKLILSNLYQTIPFGYDFLNQNLRFGPWGACVSQWAHKWIINVTVKPILPKNDGMLRTAGNFAEHAISLEICGLQYFTFKLNWIEVMLHHQISSAYTCTALDQFLLIWLCSFRLDWNNFLQQTLAAKHQEGLVY